MRFPNSGGGQPYVRLDARGGTFKVSQADGDPAIVDMKGQVIDLDLETARQGWMHVGQNGADFVPLRVADDWSSTPQPSAEHSPAIEMNVYSDAFGDPKKRQFRHNSRAATGFVAEVAEAAGDIPEGRAVRIRIKDVRIVQVGKGSTAVVEFDIAPKEKWPLLSDLDATPEAEPEVEKKAEPAPAANDWD